MVLPHLKSANLISLGQLCNDNCTILLTKHQLHTIKEGKEILQGYQNLSDGLWDIPLPGSAKVQPTRTTKHKLNIIIRKKQPAIDLVKYLHAACFSPVVSTWIRAIENNNFLTWPGLTTKLIKQHLPPSVATIQGHITREKQNLQSTTSKETTDVVEEYFPTAYTPNKKYTKSSIPFSIQTASKQDTRTSPVDFQYNLVAEMNIS